MFQSLTFCFQQCGSGCSVVVVMVNGNMVGMGVLGVEGALEELPHCVAAISWI